MNRSSSRAAAQRGIRKFVVLVVLDLVSEVCAERASAGVISETDPPPPGGEEEIDGMYR